MRIAAQQNAQGWIIQIRGKWLSSRHLSVIEKVVGQTPPHQQPTQVDIVGTYINDKNKAFLQFSEGEDAVEMAQRINCALWDTLPRVEYYVSPYHSTWGGKDGCLTLLLEIANETGIQVDWGGWNSVVTFTPEDNNEEVAVVDLLKEFGITFN